MSFSKFGRGLPWSLRALRQEPGALRQEPWSLASGALRQEPWSLALGALRQPLGQELTVPKMIWIHASFPLYVFLAPKLLILRV